MIAVTGEIAVAVGAFRDEVFAGVVTAIDPQIDVTGHSMAVRASLPNTDLRLRPGLFAQVAVSLAVNPAALMVPEQYTQRELFTLDTRPPPP